jgi:hypothetical protein
LPNLRSLATCYVRLELRPLPSTGVTRLRRYYGPLRHPAAPGHAVTGLRLVVPDHATGLPVLRALSLCTCCCHYPGVATGGTTLLIQPAVSAFPGSGSRSAHASSFSRIAQHSLALRPAHSRCHRISWQLSEGFRHFVTSMPAPVASGWSICRVGLAPTGKRRLFTAHPETGRRTHQRLDFRFRPRTDIHRARLGAQNLTFVPSRNGGGLDPKLTLASANLAPKRPPFVLR